MSRLIPPAQISVSRLILFTYQKNIAVPITIAKTTTETTTAMMGPIGEGCKDVVEADGALTFIDVVGADGALTFTTKMAYASIAKHVQCARKKLSTPLN